MERHSSNPLSHPEAFATGTLRRSGIRRHAPLVVGGCAVMLCRHGSAALRVNGNETLLSRGTMAFLVFDMTIVAGDVSPDFASEFFSIGFEATQQLFLAVTSSVFWDFIYVTPVLRLQKRRSALSPAGLTSSAGSPQTPLCSSPGRYSLGRQPTSSPSSHP